MESIYKTIGLYNPQIILVIFSFIILVGIFVTVNSFRTTKMINKYRQMMGGMENVNLETMLVSHLERLKITNSRINELDVNVERISSFLETCIQHTAIVRYNPFDQMGGDQSFSIALLDNLGHGIVLTSLYSRDGSAVYAKPLRDFQSRYPLSKEEVEVIEIAIGKNHV